MVYIPFDIILFEILMRLNARSIDQYKCVCGQWHEELSSWPFVWLHINYAEDYLVIYYSCLLLKFNLNYFLSTMFFFTSKVFALYGRMKVFGRIARRCIKWFIKIFFLLKCVAKNRRIQRNGRRYHD
ncbi:putative F-box-like domain superfamily protein [Helianthus anomalus]